MPQWLTPGNWRFFEDDAAEPVTTLAAENTKPTPTWGDDIIRLRWTIEAVGGDFNDTVALQYSIDESSWFDLGPAAAWNYADGQASEGGTTTTFKTTDGDTHGLYHENGTRVDPISNGEHKEMDFAIQPVSGGISLNTTYYFRLVYGGTPSSGVLSPQILYSYAGAAPLYFKGEASPAYGGGALLLGDPQMQAKYWGWLLGDPIMQMEARNYFAALIEAGYGKGGWLLGEISSAWGGGGYIQGIITAVPREPKPITGAWFQRLSSVKNT